MTKKQAKENTSLGEENYHKEMDKAARRIGITNAEATNWLIRFAQFNLEGLSQGEWINLQYELNRFVDSNYRTLLLSSLNVGCTFEDWEGQERFPSDTFPLPPFIQEVGAPPFRYPAMPLPSRDHVRALQKIIVALLQQLWEKKQFELWLPPVYLCIRAFPRSDAYGGHTVAKTPEASFTYNAAVLLTEGSARLRQCPECHRVFVADRKNKYSCSTRCQNKAAVRRMRQSLPKRTGKPGRPRGTTKTALAKRRKS